MPFCVSSPAHELPCTASPVGSFTELTMNDLDLGSKGSSKNEEGEGSREDLHLPDSRQSWSEDSWLSCSLTLRDPSSALVFIREEDQEVTGQRFRVPSFGYTIGNMLFLKKGTRLGMQQEVDSKGDFMLSQLPKGYRHTERVFHEGPFLQEVNFIL